MNEMKGSLLLLLCVVSFGPVQQPSWIYCGDDMTPRFLIVEMLMVLLNGQEILGFLSSVVSAKSFKTT